MGTDSDGAASIAFEPSVDITSNDVQTFDIEQEPIEHEQMPIFQVPVVQAPNNGTNEQSENNCIEKREQGSFFSHVYGI